MLAGHLSYQFDLMLATLMKKKLSDFNLDVINNIHKDLSVTFNNVQYDFDINNEFERAEYLDLKARIEKHHADVGEVQKNVVVESSATQNSDKKYQSNFKFVEVKDAFVKERMIKAGGKMTKSIDIYMASINEFWNKILSGTNPPITAINKLNARSFKEHLIGTGITAQTVDNKVAHLQAFFTFIIKNYDYPFNNPFEGLKILNRAELKKVTNSFKPFTMDELKIIFDVERYRAYYKKNIQLYFVPLIQLYSSMRVEEASQLHLDDIRQENGIYYFNLNDDEDKSLKTINAFRNIPVHSKLIEIGLIKYYEERKKLGKRTLFDNQGEYVTTEFGAYLKKLEIKKTARVHGTHSLRQNFNNALIDKDVISDVRCRLCGHELVGTNATVYGKDYKVEELKRYIELVQFPI